MFVVVLSMAHIREDLCDGCSAVAWYYIDVKGTTLAFCGHHATEWEVGLLSVGENVKDYRYMITP